MDFPVTEPLLKLNKRPCGVQLVAIPNNNAPERILSHSVVDML